jgi:hypothetical protein
MEQENKNQIAQSLTIVKEKLKQWERVYNIALDIIAYVQHDATRFGLTIGSAVGTRIIYAQVVGAEIYTTFGEGVGDKTLKEIFEIFFNDDRALANMIKQLASAIAEVAEEEIRELKERLEE